MRTKFDVDRIQVASPCHARWSDMTGDQRARFCGQCSKHVYNLSALTRVEIEELVREKQGKFCGRFYRRGDGTMLTADCPSRLRRFRERVAGVAGALCALVLSLAGCSGRQSNNNRGEIGQVLLGEVVGTPESCPTNNPPEVMGKIALPQPVPLPETNSHLIMGDISVAPAATGQQR